MGAVGVEVEDTVGNGHMLALLSEHCHLLAAMLMIMMTMLMMMVMLMMMMMMMMMAMMMMMMMMMTMMLMMIIMMMIVLVLRPVARTKLAACTPDSAGSVGFTR